MPKPKQKLSAIVLLRPASGRRISGDAQITSATLPEYLPAKDAAQKARAHFQQQGFEVSELAAISFNITASREQFEDQFGAAIDVAKGYPRVRLGNDQFAYELPLDRLPAPLAAIVEAVTFEEPAEVYGGTFP
jgi:hypothetical protein